MKGIGEVADFANGYTFLSSSFRDGGRYKVITIANVQQGHMISANANTIERLPDNIQKNQILNIGDILISMTGNVGRVCMVNEENCLLNQRVGKIIPREINKEYLYHMISLPQFTSRMVASGQGGAQDNLSSKDILNYVVSVPSRDEQMKIAAFIGSIAQSIYTEELRLANYRDWKKSLLQRMFV